MRQREWSRAARTAGVGPVQATVRWYGTVESMIPSAGRDYKGRTTQGREHGVGNESETADRGAQGGIGAHLAQLHDVLSSSPLLTCFAGVRVSADEARAARQNELHTCSHLFAFAPLPSHSIFAGTLDHQRAALSRQSVGDDV
jgi:hypothetical protein